MKHKKILYGLLLLLLVIIFALGLYIYHKPTDEIPLPFKDLISGIKSEENGNGYLLVEKERNPVEEEPAPPERDLFKGYSGTQRISEEILNAQPTDDIFQFLDLGEGYSTVILSDNKTIVIDAGSKGWGEIVHALLIKEGRNTIDDLIITSNKDKCSGGLEFLINNCNINRIYLPASLRNISLGENTEVVNKNISIKTNHGELAIRNETEDCLSVFYKSPERNIYFAEGFADIPLLVKADVIYIGENRNDSMKSYIKSNTAFMIANENKNDIATEWSEGLYNLQKQHTVVMLVREGHHIENCLPLGVEVRD